MTVYFSGQLESLLAPANIQGEVSPEILLSPGSTRVKSGWKQISVRFVIPTLSCAGYHNLFPLPPPSPHFPPPPTVLCFAHVRR